MRKWTVSTMVMVLFAMATADHGMQVKMMDVSREAGMRSMGDLDAAIVAWVEAIEWLSWQRRSAKADWTVPEKAAGVGGNTEVTK